MELQDASGTRYQRAASRAWSDTIARRLCQGSLGGFEGVRDLLQSVKKRLRFATMAAQWARGQLPPTGSTLAPLRAFAVAAERRPPRLMAVRSSASAGIQRPSSSGALLPAASARAHHHHRKRGEPSRGDLTIFSSSSSRLVRRANAAHLKMSDEKLITLLQYPKEQKKLTFVFLPEKRFPGRRHWASAERFPAFVFVVPVTVGDRAPCRGRTMDVGELPMSMKGTKPVATPITVRRSGSLDKGEQGESRMQFELAPFQPIKCGGAAHGRFHRLRARGRERAQDGLCLRSQCRFRDQRRACCGAAAAACRRTRKRQDVGSRVMPRAFSSGPTTSPYQFAHSGLGSHLGVRFAPPAERCTRSEAQHP